MIAVDYPNTDDPSRPPQPTTPTPVKTPGTPPGGPGTNWNDLFNPIADRYRSALGREINADETSTWLTQGPDGNYSYKDAGWANTIGNSPEAKAYREKSGTSYPTTSGSYQPMEGVDTGKLNDQSWQSEKYIAARILASGGSVEDAAKAVGGTALDATRFRLKSGVVIDTRRDEEGANALQWLEMGGGGSTPPPTPTSGISGGGGCSGYSLLDTIMGRLNGGGTSTSTTNTNVVNDADMAPHDTRGDDLYNTLLKRSQQSLNVNGEDPVIANQVDSYRAEQERANRRNLSALAERQGPHANLASEARQGNESVAQSTGNMQSTLMGNELTARRAEIAQALSEMGSMLSADQTRELQREMGLIDQAIRVQGLNSSNDQFIARLGLDATQQSSYWDAVRSGLI